jgi:hypothetical protein
MVASGRYRLRRLWLSLLDELDLLSERHELQLESAMPGCSTSSSGGVLVVCCCGVVVLVERCGVGGDYCIHDAGRPASTIATPASVYWW